MKDYKLVSEDIEEFDNEVEEDCSAEYIVIDGALYKRKMR